jgi:hypothetical protein
MDLEQEILLLNQSIERHELLLSKLLNLEQRKRYDEMMKENKPENDYDKNDLDEVLKHEF